VHFTALALALPAVPVLIALGAVLRGDATTVWTTSVYGISLIAMITFSLLYNNLPRPDWQPILRRLDHTAIYFKIAGTVTPFALLTDTGSTTLITVLWGAAFAGVAIQIFAPPRATARRA
jgi:hemolysin III